MNTETERLKNNSSPCDDLLIEYIDAFGSNLANLRQDVREIIQEEIDKKFEKFDALVKRLRKPKPYVEVGYRGGSY